MWECERGGIDCSVPSKEPLAGILDLLNGLLSRGRDLERPDFGDLEIIIGGGVHSLEDMVEVDSETA